MENKLGPLDILPGDTIHLTVRGKRVIPEGEYECQVLRSIPWGDNGKTLFISIPLSSATVSMACNLPNDPRFSARAFLAGDDFPVAYSHEQNLTRRLEMSIELARTGLLSGKLSDKSRHLLVRAAESLCSMSDGCMWRIAAAIIYAATQDEESVERNYSTLLEIIDDAASTPPPPATSGPTPVTKG